MDVSNAIVAKSDQLETWKSVPGFEGAYEVSDHGRVRSLDRVTDRGRRWKGKIMTPSTMPRGYQVVTLWRGGKQETALVHRLVLFAFEGIAPAGMEALHGDGSPRTTAARTCHGERIPRTSTTRLHTARIRKPRRTRAHLVIRTTKRTPMSTRELELIGDADRAAASTCDVGTPTTRKRSETWTSPTL